MTNEELAIKIKEGHTELITELWLQIEGFVKKEASKMVRLRWADRCNAVGITFDDLYVAGYFALEPAISAFDPEKGFMFLTYFNKHLKNAFYKELGVTNRAGQWCTSTHDALERAESLNAPIGNSDSEASELEDLIPDEKSEQPFDDVESQDYNNNLRADLEEAITSLRPRDAQIIRDYYFNTLTLGALAQKLDLSLTSVNTLRTQALRALRKHKALKSYREQIIGMAYKTGFSRFKNTGMSSVEAIILKLDAFERELALR